MLKCCSQKKNFTLAASLIQTSEENKIMKMCPSQPPTHSQPRSAPYSPNVVSSTPPSIGEIGEIHFHFPSLKRQFKHSIHLTITKLEITSFTRSNRFRRGSNLRGNDQLIREVSLTRTARKTRRKRKSFTKIPRFAAVDFVHIPSEQSIYHRKCVRRLKSVLLTKFERRFRAR